METRPSSPSSDSSETRPARPGAHLSAPNLGAAERWISLAVGTGVLFVARKRRGPLAWVTRAVGSALLARGTSGRSELYRALGIDARREPAAIRLRRALTVGVPAREIRAVLLDPAQLPTLLPVVTDARAVDDLRWQVTVEHAGEEPIEIGLDVVSAEKHVRWAAPEAPIAFDVTVSFSPSSRGGTGLVILARVDGADGDDDAVRRLRALFREGVGQLVRRLEPERETPSGRRAPRSRSRGQTASRRADRKSR